MMTTLQRVLLCLLVGVLSQILWAILFQQLNGKIAGCAIGLTALITMKFRKEHNE